MRHSLMVARLFRAHWQLEGGLYSFYYWHLMRKVNGLKVFDTNVHLKHGFVLRVIYSSI